MSEDEKTQILKIKGKLMWPKLHTPDTKFTPKWVTDVLLNAEGLKIARENSLRVKTNEKYKDQFPGYDGSYVQVTRNVTKRDGTDMDPPIVKDAKTRAVPSSVDIGNGTDAYVRFMVKTRDMDGTEMSPAVAMKKHGGYGMLLLGVQILNLVPYERKGNPDIDFVSDDDGSFEFGSESGGFEFEKGDDIPFDITAAG